MVDVRDQLRGEVVIEAPRRAPVDGELWVVDPASLTAGMLGIGVLLGAPGAVRLLIVRRRRRAREADAHASQASDGSSSPRDPMAGESKD
jgi:hypothetical protein